MNNPDLDQKAAIRTRAAAVFGLPREQLRFYGELDNDHTKYVAWQFNPVSPESYIYAVTATGNMVPRRERIRPEWHHEISA